MHLPALASLRAIVPATGVGAFGHSHRAFSQGPPGAWVSPEAMPKGEHLKKYARNLTKAAQDGKLDPVRHRFVRVCWLYEE
jgi:ATP-dependent Clp protease ATP-binding subunit ClpA